VGSGHLARCLALTQAWRDTGGEVILLIDDHDSWVDRYATEGVDVRPVDAPTSSDPDWLVVDGYRFGPDEGRAARARGARILVIDDQGLGRAGPADSLLDQNLGASTDRYRDRVTSDRVLLGPRFALLRREVSVARPAAEDRPVPGRARRVLLSVGGDPPPPVLGLFEAMAADLGRDHEVRWLRGAADVSVEMLEADLAVAASGSTCWELCCLGVPMAVLATTGNQRPVAEALGLAGIALDLGTLEQVEGARALEAIRELAGDAGRRQRMIAAGMDLVDARGAKRVVAHMRGDLLSLRPVAASDAGLLWRWANDAGTRASSFDPTPIPWEVHTTWLERKLADPACSMYLAASDAGLVGQIRFDQAGDRAEVAVAVAPEHRGEGLGPAVIDAGVRAFLRARRGVTVDALVKPENTASARSFDLAGFVFCGSGSSDAGRWLRYVRSGHDPL